MHRRNENDNVKSSYWKGGDSEPLRNLTMGQLIEQAAERYSSRVAISIHEGVKLTYDDMFRKVDCLAAALVNLGFKKGHHIALWGFNTVEWYLSFLAAFRAGLVVVNMNPSYQSAELFNCLKQADVDGLIMDDPLRDHNFYDIVKNVIPEIEEHDFNVHITNKRIPLLKTVVVMSKQPFKGTFNWNELFSPATDRQKLIINQTVIDTSPFDVCNMQFTSGTTSNSKCVQLTHHGIINGARIFAKCNGLYEKPHRICLQAPFFHVYGAVLGILAAIDSGCTLILPSTKFSPNKSIDCIIQEKCSMVYGTPTMYHDLLTMTESRVSSDPDIFKKMSSVELFHWTGAACLPEVVRKLNKHFEKSKFSVAYGMTETSAAVFSTSVGDPCEIVLSTVGRVIDHIEIKIINHQGQLVPFGVAGELCCKGFCVMKGYYKDATRTAEILDEEGWLHTGDKYILTENGYGKIVGRIKDLIIRGGENIAPIEIEKCIIEHPDIADVQVYGVKDARLGEAVAAAIIKISNSSLNEQDVRNYLKGKIASYKIPQYVLFVEEFPKTVSGKIQKFKLREMTENQISS